LPALIIDVARMPMTVTKKGTVRKSFRLDPAQIDQAPKLIGGATEAETIVRALDYVISEAGRSRLAARANQRFLKSGIVIADAFGSLSK
jgi:hypothetical protein